MAGGEDEDECVIILDNTGVKVIDFEVLLSCAFVFLHSIFKIHDLHIIRITSTPPHQSLRPRPSCVLPQRESTGEPIPWASHRQHSELTIRRHLGKGNVVSWTVEISKSADGRATKATKTGQGTNNHPSATDRTNHTCPRRILGEVCSC